MQNGQLVIKALIKTIMYKEMSQLRHNITKKSKVMRYTGRTRLSGDSIIRGLDYPGFDYPEF